MRSLTVPVSFSSLLFPTVPRCLSLSSLPTFLSVVCGFEGTGAGCWNSCGCANAGATTIISPIRPESTRRRCIPFWLTIDNSNYLPGDLHSSSKRDDPVSIMLGPNLDSLDGERVLPSRNLQARTSPPATDGFGNGRALPGSSQTLLTRGREPKVSFFSCRF